MTLLLTWWYRISLPPQKGPDTTPEQREHTRYAKLTSGFLLLLIVAFVPFVPVVIFDFPQKPAASPIAISMLCLLSISWIFGSSWSPGVIGHLYCCVLFFSGD